MTLRKVFLTALVLAVVAVPMTSYATVTRLIGLGGSETNYIVRDAYNPTVWPQLIKHYGMQAGLEAYGGSAPYGLHKAYVNFDFGSEASVLQLAVDNLNHRNYGMLAGTQLAGLDAVDGGYNKLNVTYGRPMGAVLVGLGLHYAGKTYVTDSDGGDIDDSYGEFGLLLGLTALEDKLDVSLGFRSGSYTVDHGGSTLAEADGASDIMLAGRYWHMANDEYTIVPSLAIGMHTDNAKLGDASHEYSTSTFRLGLGNNWTPKENLLVISEIGLRSMGETFKPDGGDETTDSQSDLFWRVGVESMLFQWLWGRFGAERDWRGVTEESELGKPEYSSSVTDLYVGATMRWNRFQGDVTLHPSFFGYGPNFLSGYDDMIFTRASLKINFDKE